MFLRLPTGSLVSNPEPFLGELRSICFACIGLCVWEGTTSPLFCLAVSALPMSVFFDLFSLLLLLSSLLRTRMFSYPILGAIVPTNCLRC